jgi:hypothetical protein
VLEREVVTSSHSILVRNKIMGKFLIEARILRCPEGQTSARSTGKTKLKKDPLVPPQGPV